MDSLAQSIAIVIPTHNPEERILKRALAAIESLDKSGLSNVECVVVDNSSQRSVSDLPCVGEFLSRCTWARVVTESRPGLVFARLAGIAATTAPVIVVLDDDNEPAADFLQVARACLEKWPYVGIMGPGCISVEFLDPVPEFYPREFGGIFNERHSSDSAYGCVPATWERYYPIGMGQVFHRSVAEAYVLGVQNGKLRATGRTKSSMASGEDIQLVWQAIKMGLAAGVHPAMRVNHLIPARRCTAAYARKVAFGCAVSYAPALVESFPSQRAIVSGGIPGNRQIVVKLCRIALGGMIRRKLRLVPVELASFIGGIIGSMRATDHKTQQWVLRLAEILRFE